MKKARMVVARSGAAAFILGALMLGSGPAHSQLFGEVAGIEARGRVDFDGFGPQPPVSDRTSTELPPFNRSVVTVADSATGSFSYLASSDIGNLALRVSGSLTNSGGSVIGEGEVGALRASAQALDVLTLTSQAQALAAPITMELEVHGTLSSGNIHANSVLSFGLLGESNGQDFGSYGPGEVVNDLLSITRNVDFPTAGSSVQMDFDTSLNLVIFTAQPGETVSGDLSNTALLRLVLPPGVSVTSSASGTFGIPLPVPEPESYALMLAGLGFLACVLARRRMA